MLTRWSEKDLIYSVDKLGWMDVNKEERKEIDVLLLI